MSWSKSKALKCRVGCKLILVLWYSQKLKKTKVRVSQIKLLVYLTVLILQANQNRKLGNYAVKRENATDVLSALQLKTMSQHTGKSFVIVDYSEQTLGSTEAIAYVQISTGQQLVCCRTQL